MECAGEAPPAAPARRLAREDCLATLRCCWQEYCSSAAIDGVHYLVEVGRSRLERIFWALALGLALAGSTHLIRAAYNKWDETPVIVTFAERSTSVWSVPFPAVTVCPVTKSRQRVFNYTAALWQYVGHRLPEWRFSRDADVADIDDSNKTYLEAVTWVCDQQDAVAGFNFTIAEGNANTDILTKVAPPVHEVISGCAWQGLEVQGCGSNNVFVPVMSDEGLCYTFNMLSNQELFTPLAVQFHERQDGNVSLGWNLEDGYPADAGLDTFPRRALVTAARSNLDIFLTAYTQDCDYLCKGQGQGFKVLLHNPAEVPRVGRQQHFLAPLNHDVVAVVKPAMMTTSAGLRDYRPQRRQCYFPHERQLRYFKVYTQKNCELECSTNFTVRLCACAAFYMPRTYVSSRGVHNFWVDLDCKGAKANDDTSYTLLILSTRAKYLIRSHSFFQKIFSQNSIPKFCFPYRA